MTAKQQAIQPNKSHLFASVYSFLGYGFGSGLLAKAPGTYGTIAAIPVYLLLYSLGWSIYGLLVLLGIVFGVKICQYCCNQLKAHDHGAIVWDEIVGFCIAMFLVPLTWWTLILGFVLFRAFDIFKPWPINFFDKKMNDALGIMLDDVVAGIMACIVLHIIISVLL